ncbi:STAS domain-containing protein [Streptomyces sp. NPDC096324]|uniref:STAS domain-containing protein n=1 Tax=Streptomyces sp. NPDC096324 TaxID=3366085 RepID=UPI0037F92FB0
MEPLPPGRASMSVSPAPAGAPVLVAVHGELDLVSGGRIRDRLGEALAVSSSGLELDLSGVGFCDCAGLNVLLELRHRALVQDKTVTIRAAGLAVGRLLDLAGAQELFSSPRPRVRAPASSRARHRILTGTQNTPGLGMQRARPPAPRVSEPA